MLHHVIIGSGRPVLVLHGSTLDHRHMRDSLEPIFAQQDGWQRIYIDLPGHGLSPAQDDIATQDDLLASVLAFIDQALPNQRFAIIGESRGSYLARGITYLRPEVVTGLALIVPGGNPSADPARLPAHEIIEPDPSLRAGLKDEELEHFENFMVVQRQDVIERIRRVIDPAQALWDKAQADRIWTAFDFSFHRELETTQFTGPSVIIAGRFDSWSGYRDAIDLVPQFPRATLGVLDAAGHSLAGERPDIFAALIHDWLARLYKVPT